MSGRFRLPLWVAWSLVFGANTIAPGVMGSMEARVYGGFTGIGLGLVVLWFAGLAVCVWRPEHGRLLVKGGVIVGACQIIPVLQFGAGFVAFTTTLMVTDEPEAPATFCFFLLTSGTGGQLMALAYIIGRLFCLPSGNPKPPSDVL